MPTYEYKCTKCAHRFEKFQSMTAKHIRKCPQCSGTVKRLIGSGAGIIFKGSGFYQTDYRSSSYREKATQETKGSSNGSGEKTEKKSTSTESSPSKSSKTQNPSSEKSSSPSPNKSKASPSS